MRAGSAWRSIEAISSVQVLLDAMRVRAIDALLAI